MTEFAHSSFKDFLLDSLREDIVTVEFNKKDGSKRVMKCTLSKDSIPEDQWPKDKVTILYNEHGEDFGGMHSSDDVKIQPEHTIRVFDIEKNSWRSFITSNVLSINGVSCKDVCK